MSAYQRTGQAPKKFAVVVRLEAGRDGEVAQRLYEMPRHAPKVIRLVLEDAIKNGRFDVIAEEVIAKG